jgi:CDP-glucose 4,6-dehydratase
VPIDPDFWAQRRVLLTGHTGFKGAWLSLWLQSLGARVTGLASGSPTEPSLYELAGVGAEMDERAIDVRDAEGVREALRSASPEIVLHMAAQPMVRRSLRDPRMTYEVNVMGTVNVLEAVRQAGGEVRAVVVVTSDKCYENPAHGGSGAHGEGSLARDWPGAPGEDRDPGTPAGRGDPGTPAGRGFVEGDPLGGADPYSSSKACAELVTTAYRESFFSGEDAPRVASARAGNVIGGGDWGEDRLLGDIVRAVQTGEPVSVRNPQAVRPWQHVLNPLSGYLRLAEELWRSQAAAEAWNFGPLEGDARTVRWIVERLQKLWGGAFEWEPDRGENPPEAGHLALDSGKAERRLGWRAEWDLAQALERIVEWHEAERRGEDMRRVSLEQIERFGRASGRGPGAHKS